MTKLTICVAALALTCVAAYLPANYQSRTAAEKQEILWTQLGWELYGSNIANYPSGGPGVLDIAKLLVPSYHTVAFTRESDELPDGRKKLLHPFGSCAKATLEINADASINSYTGVFKAGTIASTIVRPSVAKWDNIGEGLAPGAGLKVLIDGKASQNFHLLFTTEGQGPKNNNFFLNGVTNAFPLGATPASAYLVVKSMELALKLLAGGAESRPIGLNTLGLVEQASVEVSGRIVPSAEIRAPFKVEFVPPTTLHTAPTNTLDFRKQLEALPAGTRLYDVFAYATPESPAVNIGHVTTTSALISSVYCDETLYFQHARKPWTA